MFLSLLLSPSPFLPPGFLSNASRPLPVLLPESPDPADAPSRLPLSTAMIQPLPIPSSWHYVCSQSTTSISFDAPPLARHLDQPAVTLVNQRERWRHGPGSRQKKQHKMLQPCPVVEARRCMIESFLQPAAVCALVSMIVRFVSSSLFSPLPRPRKQRMSARICFTSI